MRHYVRERTPDGCEVDVIDKGASSSQSPTWSAGKARCMACGRLIGRGEHRCASVDLKGERLCRRCEKVLTNTGYERWKNYCGPCEKARWRQQERDERAKLRAAFGGQCEKCGYDRCTSALHFHHLDRSEKYVWNPQGKGGTSVREIKAHPERFQLLCSNCHIETHQGDKHEDLPGK
jgi:hypothetical protein